MSMPNRERREELRRDIEQYPHAYIADADELRAVLDALDRRTALLRRARKEIDDPDPLSYLDEHIDAELEQDNDSK